MKTLTKLIALAIIFVFAVGCDDGGNSGDGDGNDSSTVAVPEAQIWYDNPTTSKVEVEVAGVSWTANAHAYSNKMVPAGESQKILVKADGEVVLDTAVKLEADAAYFLNAGRQTYYVQLVNYGEEGDEPNPAYNQNREILYERVVTSKPGAWMEMYEDYFFVVVNPNEMFIRKFWNRHPNEFLGAFEYLEDGENPDGYLRKLWRGSQFEVQAFCDAKVMLTADEINQLSMIIDLLNAEPEEDRTKFKETCAECEEVWNKLSAIQPYVANKKGILELYEEERAVIFDNRMEDAWVICSAKLEAAGESGPLGQDQIDWMDEMFEDIKSGLDISGDPRLEKDDD